MTFLVQKTMAILNINSYLNFGLEKKLVFWKINLDLIFGLGKE